MKDPKARLKGRLQARWAPEGLLLRQPKSDEILVPVGSEAETLGPGKFSVEVGRRQVTLAVAGVALYQQRLAEDVVAYLNGKRRGPDPRGYSIPWYLFAPAFLPLGIPIVTLGGALWAALGAGLFGACLAVARIEKLPAGVRVLLSLLLAGLGYGIVFAVVLAVGIVQWMSQNQSNPAAVNPGVAPPRPAPQPLPRPKEPQPPPGQLRVLKMSGQLGESFMYAAFAPDGKTLATVSNRQTLELWDPKTGAERFSETKPTGGSNIGLLIFSPDSRWVVAWDGQGPLKMRDGTGKAHLSLDFGGDAYYSYGAFSPDSKLLAVTAGDRVRLWRAPEGKPDPVLDKMIQTPRLTYNSAQFTPDGKTLLTGGFYNLIDGPRLDQAWDLTAGKFRSDFKGFNPKHVGRMLLSPDGRLALMQTDKTAEVVDWQANRQVRLLTADGPTSFASVVFDRDGRHLISLASDGLVTRWEIDSGKGVATFKAQGPGGALAVSADGKTVATARWGELTLWDADRAFQPAGPR
jgi:hypothetical protein